jgi:DNA-binding response OmpR family regulator
MLCEALTLAGFQCQSADNGLAGLSLIDSTMPDVAIVDVGLPAMDGFELARRIRADAKYAGVRLIALTGYGQREDRQHAIEAGFNVHLVKPIEPLELVRLLGGSF